MAEIFPGPESLSTVSLFPLHISLDIWGYRTRSSLGHKNVYILLGESYNGAHVGNKACTRKTLLKGRAPLQPLKEMTNERLIFPTSIICSLHQQKQAEMAFLPLFSLKQVLCVLSSTLPGEDPGPSSVHTLLSSAPALHHTYLCFKVTFPQHGLWQPVT